MKTNIKLIAVIFIATTMISSCKKKDETVPVPTINLTELGYENSKIGYAGNELHMDADIVAEGKINKVNITIHPEAGHLLKTSKFRSLNEDWIIDTTYMEFNGLKNTTFHEHLDIPVNATPGHYHFHLTVTDQEGQQSSVEDELEILPDSTSLRK